jgi:hypothetical protein
MASVRIPFATALIIPFIIWGAAVGPTAKEKCYVSSLSYSEKFLNGHGHHLVSRVYTMGSMFMLSEHASHAHSLPTNP